MTESRLSKSVKNLQAAWIGQFLNIFAKFVMRRFFVRYISNDYLGLDAVFSNIIGLLNLAELGIGSAVFYTLYKPLAEQNEEEILGIMQLLAKVYRTIAMILCGIGVLLMPFITVIAPEADGLQYVHLLFGFYLVNTCVSYLFTYKGLLASADQKNYITLRNHYFFIISLNVVQIFIIYFTRNFVIYAAVQCLFTLSEGISLSLIMNKEYPILKRKDKIVLPREHTNRIWSDVRKIVVGRVGTTIISSTDNLILSNVSGLSQTGVYSNYALIEASLQAIVSQLSSAVLASIGNIVAVGEKEKELDYFWLLNFITATLYAVTATCMFNLIQPFIAYWLGGKNMLDNNVIFCLTMIYFCGGIRSVFGSFTMAHGLFDLDAKKAILEAVGNLVFSIILAMHFGMVGVLLGTIISSLFIGLPLELVNVGRALPAISKRKFIVDIAGYSLGTAIILFVSNKLCNMVSMHWYIRLPVGLMISVIVFIAIWWFLFGRRTNFKRAVKLAKDIIYEKLFHNFNYSKE